MLKNKLITLITVLSVLALGACSSSNNNNSGGGGGGLATGGFTKSFGITDSGNNSFPFDATRDLKTQFLYTPAEINGSGNITTLRFSRGTVPAAAVTCPNVTIKLGHSSLAALTATFGNNVEQGKGSQVTALNDATINIPLGAAGEWFDVSLTTSFYYNGVDNLVVEVEKTTACSENQRIDVFSAANRRVQSNATDTMAGIPEHDQVTGVADGSQPWMRFVFAGGVNKVDFNTSTNANLAPLSTSAGFQKTQMLYNASAIDGSGPITGIGLQVSGTTAANTYTYSMKLGHTTLTDLVATYADNFDVGSPVTVANSATFIVPDGVPTDEFIWLPVPDGVFTYNGTDNLVIELTIEAASGNTSLETHSTANINRIYGNPANADASTLNSYTHQIELRFNGSTIDQVIGTGGTDASRWFTTSGTGSIDQYLYHATELGTKGAITKIACRIGTTSTATTYPNFEVVMSHTAATTLVTTLATNVPTPVTAYSGTFSLPVGLIDGDWIEIPLTTSFSYDGLQNLVIQVSSDAGANAHSCSVLNDAARFPDRRTNTTDRSSPTGTNFDHLKDVRLWITK